jgi:hypothetical protein
MSIEQVDARCCFLIIRFYIGIKVVDKCFCIVHTGIKGCEAMKSYRKHIPLAERLKDWEDQPYKLNAEDSEWINLKLVGKEIC